MKFIDLLMKEYTGRQLRSNELRRFNHSFTYRKKLNDKWNKLLLTYRYQWEIIRFVSSKTQKDCKYENSIYFYPRYKSVYRPDLSCLHLIDILKNIRKILKYKVLSVHKKIKRWKSGYGF